MRFILQKRKENQIKYTLKCCYGQVVIYLQYILSTSVRDYTRARKFILFLHLFIPFFMVGFDDEKQKQQRGGNLFPLATPLLACVPDRRARLPLFVQFWKDFNQLCENVKPSRLYFSLSAKNLHRQVWGLDILAEPIFFIRKIERREGGETAMASKEKPSARVKLEVEYIKISVTCTYTIKLKPAKGKIKR